MAVTDTTINTSAAPEGVLLRPVTLDDAEAVAELLNARAMAITGRPETTAEWIAADWDSPGFDLRRDTRLAIAADGTLAGYAEVYGNHARSTRVWGWICLHPDRESAALGDTLMGWIEQRAHQFVPKAPDGARVLLVAGVDNNDGEQRALLRRHGLAEERYFWHMEIAFDAPPPAPVMPDGITIRPMREGEQRAVFAAADEAFEDHFGHVEEPFEQAFERWWNDATSNPVFDPGLYFVAEADDGQIAGVSLCIDHRPDDPERGWVRILGVRRPWRRQGLALALLLHSFGALHARGKPRVGLGVDADSLTGATRLYEKAGMHVSREFTQFTKELRAGEDLSVQTLEG